MKDADAIVVGGGQNGLAAAAMLARDGLRTVVVEARETLGGACAGVEFHPGYRHVGVHHDSDTVPAWVVEALQLSQHGLQRRDTPPVFLPTAIDQRGAASGVLLTSTPSDAELGADAAGVRDYRAWIDGVRALVCSVMDAPAPPISADGPTWPLLQQAVALRWLGADRMTELLRVGALAAEDWLAERIASPSLRAGLVLPALLGAYMGPRSPQSAALLLLREALSGSEVRGGPAGFVDALIATAKHHGVQFTVGAAAERIRVVRGRVEGVVLRGGRTLRAPMVVSALDPRRTLLDLLPPEELSPQLEDEARNIRVRVTSAKLHLALSGPVRFACREGAFERFRVAPDPGAVERAFDHAKHGRLPDSPVLDVRVPTVHHPELAPAGHHVLSAHVFGVPGDVHGGAWTPATRERLVDAAIRVLSTVAPGIADQVVAAELLVAPEIEARYGLSGGHLMHGEHALDQLWVGRPGPQLSRHRTPIQGLFLASGGTHPHGWVGAAAGCFAGRAATEGR